MVFYSTVVSSPVMLPHVSATLLYYRFEVVPVLIGHLIVQTVQWLSKNENRDWLQLQFFSLHIALQCFMFLWMRPLLQLVLF